MSKYKSWSDNSDVICPYCKYEFQPEAEDYSDDVVVEECGGCGKKFHRYDDLTITHYSKPDCDLNSDNHEWEEYQSIFGDYYRTCKVCGKLESAK